jgi:hypothetical protein
MQTDQDLAELFERAVADLIPDVAGMVRRSEQLGRGLRRRGRFSRTGSSALAVVLAIAAVSVASAWPFHLHAATPTEALETGHPAASTGGGHQTGKQALHFARQRSQDAKPMSRDQMLRTLRSLLPVGSVLSPVAAGMNGPGSLEVNYNDGQGPADVMISITPFSKVVTPQQMGTTGSPTGKTRTRVPFVLALACPDPLWTDEGTRPAGALPISCLLRTPPGGGVERDAVMYADGYGFYGYDIYDQRPDGVEVFIQVGNGYFDPYLPHVDRPTPPGSMALWASVVENPAWHA